MQIKLVIDISSICVTSIGTLLLAFYSPRNKGQLFMHTIEGSIREEKKARFKNNMMNVGLGFILIGIVLQVISLRYN